MVSINPAQVFYYSIENDYANWAGMEVEFDQKLDAGILEKAINSALVRYPYFAGKLAIRGEAYVLEKNNNPVRVYSAQEKPDYLFGPQNNDYMFRFSVKESTLSAKFFHGLCDARGFEPFLKTILFEYFNTTENRTYKVDGVNLVDSPINKEEYTDPHAGRTFEGGKPVATKPIESVYQLPEEFDRQGRRFSYKIELDSDEFMAFAKAANGSPNAIVSMFMANAVLAERQQASERILSGVAIDSRPVHGVTKSHHSMIFLGGLHHKKELEGMPLSAQAACYREMLLLQSDSDNIIPMLSESKKLHKIIDSQVTLADKKNIAASIIRSNMLSTTFQVSYMGAMSFGEIDNHIKSFYLSFDMKCWKMAIEIGCIKHKLFINIMQGFLDDRYVKAFVRQLEAAGIGCVCRKSEIIESVAVDCPLSPQE